MAWKLNIPKILHVYWGTGKIPFIRFLTLYSFKKFNPEWDIWFWYPKFPSRVITWDSRELNYLNNFDDYTSEVNKLKVKNIAVDMTEYGIKNEISEVHKSDFIRYWILMQYGGVYSDMDIIYFKSIENIGVNRARNKNKETFVCIGIYGHSNGFFMASQGSLFFKLMFNLAYQINPYIYQSVGPDLCNANFPTIEGINKVSPAANIGMEAVYYYTGQNVDRLYGEKDLIFHKDSIGCHWYAGSQQSGKFLNSTNGGSKNLPNNIIGNLCRGFLS